LSTQSNPIRPPSPPSTQPHTHAHTWQVKATKRYHESIAAFVEEGIVRRELSDNFCFYQPHYDSLEGAAGWARESLRLHA
jgi:deoxyribodipyrimidine photo-lyase